MDTQISISKNSAQSDIVRLVKYITSEQEKAHRIGEVMITNCELDDPEHAALEMLLTQAHNRRAKSDPTYHLLLSFRPGEEPTQEVLHRVEKEVCERLGFGEHQRISKSVSALSKSSRTPVRLHRPKPTGRSHSALPVP